MSRRGDKAAQHAGATPTGQPYVRSPTPHVWLLARTAVYGPEDLDAARAAQSGLALVAPPATAGIASQSVTRAATWEEYFTAAAQLMAINRPPLTDQALLRSVAALDLEHFDATRFNADERTAIAAGMAEAQQLVLGAGGAGYSRVDGWAYPSADLGVFGQNYLFRARIAVSALAALPPIEAMYLRAIGEGHTGCFDGLRCYRLRFAPGNLPPAQSFWSLTLYDATVDGQFFFADNPLNRYSIGDRTPGLVFESDGSLELLIGSDPGPSRRANWLPSSGAPFALFLRAYLPSADLLEGRYRLPAITACPDPAACPSHTHAALDIDPRAYMKRVLEEVCFGVVEHDPLERTVDRYFSADYRQTTDGHVSTHQEFVDHIRALRQNVVSGGVEVLEAIVRDDRIADRHIVTVQKKDGSIGRIEVWLFGEFDPDGRFRRVDEVTRLLAGTAEDARLARTRS